MTRYFLFLSLLIFIMITLTITRAVVVNSFSGSGIDLSSINNEIDSIDRENVKIRQKVLEMSSLTNIYEDSLRKGFVKSNSNSQVVMSEPLPLAYSR